MKSRGSVCLAGDRQTGALSIITPFDNPKKECDNAYYRTYSAIESEKYFYASTFLRKYKVIASQVTENPEPFQVSLRSIF